MTSLLEGLAKNNCKLLVAIPLRNPSAAVSLNFYSCFLSHTGAFWGAFLVPILLVMAFNTIVFICIIFVLIRHVSRRAHHTKQKIHGKDVILMMVRIGGVMALFGLTWLFGTLTISVSGLRETFQILFTVFNSFQGVFIFLFFCVFNNEACKSWKELYHRNYRKKHHFQVSKFPTQHKTSVTVSTINVSMSSFRSKSETVQLPIYNSEAHSDLPAEKKRSPQSIPLETFEYPSL